MSTVDAYVDVFLLDAGNIGLDDVGVFTFPKRPVPFRAPGRLSRNGPGKAGETRIRRRWEIRVQKAEDELS